MKNLKNFTIPIIFSLVLLFTFVIQIQAEQSGNSPESGSDSYLKQGYDWLVAKGANYGGTDSTDWSEDWGIYWNRIMEAAAWEPGGDLASGDVFSGKTFYGGSNDRDVQTGTFTQGHENQIWDDWVGSGDCDSASLASAYAASQDQCEDESTWIEYTDSDLNGELIASGLVYLDERTGLYWSDCYSSVSGDNSCDTRTNSFTLNGVVDDTDDNLDAEGGQAVDFCEALELDADGLDGDDTDWRLPSQKELLLVVINGSGNNLIHPGNTFWASTQSYTGTGNAWIVGLHNGFSISTSKTNTNYARCVRRD